MHPYLRGAGPIVLAHRGGAAEAPENSRAAVEHTIALGIGYLETDVHATADGVAFLSHDPTLDRVTAGAGRIDALTAREVARVRDSAGEPLLRLDELLADYPDLRVNIDAKSDGAVAPLVAAVRSADASDRVCIGSFSDARLARVRAALPGVATSLAPREVVRLLATARTLGPAAAGRLRPVPGPADAVVAAQVPVRARGVRVVTPRFVAAAHRLGLAVHVWTVDDPGQMARLLDLGVDGLVTDRPTVARDVVAARGPWH